MGEARHTAELKEQIARFLHTHKDDGGRVSAAGAPANGPPANLETSKNLGVRGMI